MDGQWDFSKSYWKLFKTASDQMARAFALPLLPAWKAGTMAGIQQLSWDHEEKVLLMV